MTVQKGKVFFSILMIYLTTGLIYAACNDMEKKIDELLSQMTIEEKAGQCNQSGFGPYERYMRSKTGLGHIVIQQGGDIMSCQAALTANRLQKIAVKETRLGIPLLIGCDGILDARVADSTTFPQPIGMASTWDPNLIQQAYAVMAHEMRAVGYGRTYAPNVGIGRDPRFGRTGETFGEDTYLVMQMAVAAVRGLQGDSLKTGILATSKHFVAYDATLGGKDSSPIDVSERALREVWLPPFKATVNERVGAIMCAYHAINGIPCAANKWLLMDILKKEWGFKGFVVTDFMCVKALWEGQHIVDSFDAAARLAFESGIDVYDHDINDDFASRLSRLVEEGKISESVLNDACRRTLRAKFELGLFDNPYVDPNEAEKIVGCAKHRKIALQVARESIILLKNENNLLPLRKDIRSIAVIGPNADSIRNQLGVWVKEVVPPYDTTVITLLEGIQKEVSSQTKVYYEKGCDILPSGQPIVEGLFTFGQQVGLKGEYFNNQELAGEPALVRIDKGINFDWSNSSPDANVDPDNFSVRWTGKMKPPVSGEYKFSVNVDDGVRIIVGNKTVINAWPDHVGASEGSIYLETGREYDLRVEYHENGGQARITMEILFPLSYYCDAEIQKAVEAARKSDVAVVAIGDSPDLNAECHDRANLDLTGYQNHLVKAVYETGTPTVVILVNARPLTVNYVAENIPAILEVWNPGEQGGKAVVEVLFGDYNPSGKLPITFPRSTGQLPVYYNHEPGWHTDHYVCGTIATPLYPFGYGLSYTTFEYDNLRLSSKTITSDQEVALSVDVKNTGKFAGDEVLQLYINDPVASCVRPIKELKGFQRISLKPGENRTVKFTITPDNLAFYNREMKWVVEPGLFNIMVGDSSINFKTISLQVVEKR